MLNICTEIDKWISLAFAGKASKGECLGRVTRVGLDKAKSPVERLAMRLRRTAAVSMILHMVRPEHIYGRIKFSYKEKVLQSDSLEATTCDITELALPTFQRLMTYEIFALC